MTAKKSDPAANAMSPTTTYVHKGIPYVPHYRIPQLYVAPGGATKTALELSFLKAKAKTMNLWTREWGKK